MKCYNSMYFIPVHRNHACLCLWLHRHRHAQMQTFCCSFFRTPAQTLGGSVDSACLRAFFAGPEAGGVRTLKSHNKKTPSCLPCLILHIQDCLFSCGSAYFSDGLLAAYVSSAIKMVASHLLWLDEDELL